MFAWISSYNNAVKGNARLSCIHTSLYARFFLGYFTCQQTPTMKLLQIPCGIAPQLKNSWDHRRGLILYPGRTWPQTNPITNELWMNSKLMHELTNIFLLHLYINIFLNFCQVFFWNYYLAGVASQNSMDLFLQNWKTTASLLSSKRFSNLSSKDPFP